ncbi:hypothetical protein J5T34_05980 [Cupriavidus gilardii]|uniref:hypothetical protein n=1 Tax=Cupriavidus gilardii TaxID=82541 RepID=UPI001ABE67B2|nr:hypothetical protein [Cupriavidus gilardii]MBO4120288.1 hypothetical protein [Cupriavidus gilardii]
MKTFRSMGDFAEHLAKMAVESAVVTNHMTDQTAAAIEKTAKAEIGHYQPAVGPFAKWEELTAETEFDKIRHGYPVDAPLLRTGGMRDSIERTVIGNEAAVGSNDDKMVWHEQGTEKVPPRAVLGPAAVRVSEDLQDRLTRVVVAWLAGRGWRRPRLK